MKCPVDGATLAMTERDGVEIDYCPECRGIWLDRGELDKIIERAGAYREDGRNGSEHDRGDGAGKVRRRRFADLFEGLGGD